MATIRQQLEKQPYARRNKPIARPFRLMIYHRFFVEPLTIIHQKH
jgi:hypothetical protein